MLERGFLTILINSCITLVLLLSYIVDLIDVYYGGPTLIWVAFLEAVMVAFFYGVPTFVNDLVEITRSEALARSWPVFYLFYYFLTPAALTVATSHISTDAKC